MSEPLDRMQRAKWRTEQFMDAWRQRRIEEGKRIGRTPCLHSSHQHLVGNPDLLFSSPHLHRDFGDCDGWLDDVGEAEQ